MESEQLTPHFTRKEMRCPCCKECHMEPNFMDALEKFRAEIGYPLNINSGWRCSKHNAELFNSSATSLHLKGLAADISWDEFSASQKRKMIEKALLYFAGIGIGKTYLHVDWGSQYKLWVY